MTVKEISTGITGLTAYKCGKVAMLRYYGTITATSEGWFNIGNLPDSLKPILPVESIAIDNNASSFSSTHYSSLRINRSDGSVTVYMFRDKLSLNAIFSVTYITNS